MSDPASPFARFPEADRLLAALLTRPAEERAAVVAELRAEDPELGAEVAELLRLEEEEDSLLVEGGALAGGLGEALTEESIAHEDATLPVAARLRGRRIGPWRILRELGRGGMAVVYLAERADGAYEQEVALKLLQTSPQAAELVGRFERERQILASLKHPHIAGLIDGGLTEDGQPWFAMEYVEGLALDRSCDRRRLTVDERLELFIQVARAVQAAHRTLVVHRDLKPSNILVTEEGEPRLLDFGIAKPLDPDAGAAAATRTLPMLTPEYASPEQVRGEPVTTASDVYQLGLLLYELLTGVRAQRVASRSATELERVVLEQGPPPPSVVARVDDAAPARAEARRTTVAELARCLAGDLDAIILQALRKEPERRYASAAELAEDVRRHLAALPVTARPDSLRYRVGRFARRHVLGVAASLGVFVLVSAVVGIYTYRLAQSRDHAATALAETEQALSRAEALQVFLVDLFRATEPVRPQDELPTTEELLALGARRALDEQMAPPAERFEMLLTIGDVYLLQQHNERARPLLEAAVALAREHQGERPEDLARALHQRSLLARNSGSLAEARVLLLEAESVLGDNDTLLNTFTAVRSHRGLVEHLMGNDQQALRLLEPLYRQIRGRREVDGRVRAEMMSHLATVWHVVGNLEAATELRTAITEIRKRMDGPESHSYAVSLINSASAESDVGRFSVAESRAREAIALYDRISPEPVAFRAAARGNLALILLSEGRFDEALAEWKVAGTEWALVLDREIDSWAEGFRTRGLMLSRMHRWEAAESDLIQARNLFVALDPDEEPRLAERATHTDALLAWTLCHQQKTAEGASVLTQLDARLEGQLPANPVERAQVHEARATCDFWSGRSTTALREVDLALATDTYPGNVIYHTDRKILRARILAALDRDEEAERELEQAAKLFLDLDSADHPLFPEIEATREDLLGK